MLGRGTRWLGAGLLLWGCNQLYGIDDLRYVEGASTSSVGGSGEGGGAGSGGMGGAPPTGVVSWVRGYGEGLAVTIADMAVLADGRIALVGWFQGGDLVLDQTLSPIEGELRPAFFALFDAAGTPLFSSLIGEGALELALAAGPDALYLAVSYDMPIALGMDLSPSTLADVVVARFVEVSGTFGIDWVRSFASTGTQRSPRLVSTDLGVLLALEYAPAFQIGGLTMVALGGRDIALVDLDLGGTAIDARSLGGAEQDLLDALVATPSGFYLGGQHLAALDDEDCSLPSPKGNANFVLSLDALATCKTALSFGSPLTNAPIRLAPAPSGYFVAGHSDGMLDLVGATSQGDNDMFLARIDDFTKGGVVWAKRFGDALDQTTAGVAAGATRVVLLGTALGDVDFGAGALPGGGTGDDSADAVVGVFDLDGDLREAYRWSSDADVRASAVEVDDPRSRALVVSEVVGEQNGGLMVGGEPVSGSFFLVELDL